MMIIISIVIVFYFFYILIKYKIETHKKNINCIEDLEKEIESYQKNIDTCNILIKRARKKIEQLHAKANNKNN